MSKHKGKKVRVELIPPKHPAYVMMAKIRKRYHYSTRKAKIALMWRIAYRPDRDGHLVLGKCKKASDFQRELAEYDFVILLNKEVWNDKKFGERRQRALLDHELCHAARLERHGKSVKDERGRYCWRMRDHEIEEFREIVERHGLYKADLERFAEAILKAKRRK